MNLFGPDGRPVSTGGGTEINGSLLSGRAVSSSMPRLFGSPTAGVPKDYLNKEGQFLGGGTSNVTQTPSFWYSPELTTESWLLPKSRQEILKWCRLFFNLEGYVQSILMTHALYPFSKFDITTGDKSVDQFYRDVAFQKDLDLYRLIVDASLSFEQFGEAIFFMTMEQDAEVDPVTKRRLWRWKRAVLLEPEIVEIKQEWYDPDPIFEMIPTDDMKAMAKATDSQTIERRKKVPEIVMDAIAQNRNIPLDTESVSYIYRKTSPSGTRGTPVIQCIFKTLIYQDFIRLAQMAIANRYHFPIEIWTLGDTSLNPPYIPSEGDLDAMRNLINTSLQQPPFSIVVPPILKYEPVSVMGKLLPVKDDYDYIQDQIFVGLGVNRTLMTGEGPAFSNLKAISLQKLVMGYKAKRDLFENWMINRFFRPLAERNEFYTVVAGRKQLILPQISWYKSLDIEEQESERKDYKELHGKGYVSTKTLLTKYQNLDFDKEKKLLEEEIGTIWDKNDRRLPKEFKKPSETEKESPAETMPEASAEESSAPTMPAGPAAEAPAETPATPPAEVTPPAGEVPGAPPTPAT